MAGQAAAAPKRRGRKQNDDLPPSRSRDIQRAFRARRAALLSNLEARVVWLEAERSELLRRLGLPHDTPGLTGDEPTLTSVDGETPGGDVGKNQAGAAGGAEAGEARTSGKRRRSGDDEGEGERAEDLERPASADGLSWASGSGGSIVASTSSALPYSLPKPATAAYGLAPPPSRPFSAAQDQLAQLPPTCTPIGTATSLPPPTPTGPPPPFSAAGLPPYLPSTVPLPTPSAVNPYLPSSRPGTAGSHAPFTPYIVPPGGPSPHSAPPPSIQPSHQPSHPTHPSNPPSGLPNLGHYPYPSPPLPQYQPAPPTSVPPPTPSTSVPPAQSPYGAPPPAPAPTLVANGDGAAPVMTPFSAAVALLSHALPNFGSTLSSMLAQQQQQQSPGTSPGSGPGAVGLVSSPHALALAQLHSPLPARRESLQSLPSHHLPAAGSPLSASTSSLGFPPPPPHSTGTAAFDPNQPYGAHVRAASAPSAGPSPAASSVWPISAAPGPPPPGPISATAASFPPFAASTPSAPPSSHHPSPASASAPTPGASTVPGGSGGGGCCPPSAGTGSAASTPAASTSSCGPSRCGPSSASCPPPPSTTSFLPSPPTQEAQQRDFLLRCSGLGPALGVDLSTGGSSGCCSAPSSLCDPVEREKLEGFASRLVDGALRAAAVGRLKGALGEGSALGLFSAMDGEEGGVKEEVCCGGLVDCSDSAVFDPTPSFPSSAVRDDGASPASSSSASSAVAGPAPFAGATSSSSSAGTTEPGLPSPASAGSSEYLPIPQALSLLSRYMSLPSSLSAGGTDPSSGLRQPTPHGIAEMLWDSYPFVTTAGGIGGEHGEGGMGEKEPPSFALVPLSATAAAGGKGGAGGKGAERAELRVCAWKVYMTGRALEVRRLVVDEGVDIGEAQRRVLGEAFVGSA
ncbi:hypothetical protein JCM8097_004988 [Rhodosporidiobolus ruineniae]